MCHQVVESVLCRKCHRASTTQKFHTHKCPSAFLPWAQPCMPQVVHKNSTGLHRCAACKRASGGSWVGRVGSKITHSVDRVVHPRGSGNLYGPDLYSIPLSRNY